MHADPRDELPFFNDNVEPVAATGRTRSRGMVMLMLLALAGVGGSGFLGVRLYESHGRERQIRAELEAAIAERDSISLDLRYLAARHSATQSELRQVTESRDSALVSLVKVRSDLRECAEARDEAISAARKSEGQLEDIASAIRIGMMGLASIPPEEVVFSFGSGLEYEYQKLVSEYNDLVSRFNAAVERSNDLVEIVNRVIRSLMS